MSKLQYTLVGDEDGANIVVFLPGFAPQVAHSTHPNFEAILEAVKDGDEDVIDLFDVAQTVAKRFNRLSERVSVANDRIYLDGVEVNNALTEQVLRFMDAGLDFMPLVKFFENVQANPNEHSREQLYAWLQRDFSITRDGMIVGYKGVAKDGTGFKSIHSGKAIVDGQEVTGRIPTNIGSIIEMPRDEVQWDPGVGCHRGLHVGTYEYAEGFAQGALLEVHVNPRDVVSVPTDCGAAKMRCCRYVIVDTIDAPYTSPLAGAEDGDYEWGELED